MKLAVRFESWPLREPFETSRERLESIDMVHVELTAADGFAGQAEACGVDYDEETPASLAVQLEAFKPQVDASLTRERLATLLPPGGARNAIDCALWDLECKRARQSIWQLTGLGPPRALVTAFTIGLGSEAEIAERARRSRDLPLIKLKLDAERHIDLVRLVREHAPQPRLIVDANEGFTREKLEAMLPALAEAGVEMIEQPVPRGEDEQLRGLVSPIPLCADESCATIASLPALEGLYDAVNIKLDKTGGLTEALALAKHAQARGFRLMVGCMCGTSLGMAAAYPIAMLAQWVDLDGPLLLSRDREPGLTIVNGWMEPPSQEIWG
jgi:L-Ala-D/L-Glu epimerase